MAYPTPTTERNYDMPEMAVNKYPEPDRITLRDEIRNMQDGLRRLEEALNDAHKRLAMHDERLTRIELGIGE